MMVAIADSILDASTSQIVECLRKRKYPAGTPGFGDLTPSNFKFPPQIDESRILYFRDDDFSLYLVPYLGPFTGNYHF